MNPRLTVSGVALLLSVSAAALAAEEQREVVTPVQDAKSGSRQSTDRAIKSSSSAKVVSDEDLLPTEKQMAEWNKPIRGIHPIKRIVRPIWKLKQQAAELQTHIIELRRPIDSLQPTFARMEVKIAQADEQMLDIRGQLTRMNANLNEVAIYLPKVQGLSQTLGIVREDLRSVLTLREDIRGVSAMRADILSMSKQMKELEKPLHAVQQPMIALISPMESIQHQVAQIGDKMSTVQAEVTLTREQLISVHQKIEEVKKPLNDVAQPLAEVRGELKELNRLLRTVLLISVALISSAMVAVVIGITFLYRMKDRILPVATRIRQRRQEDDRVVV